MLPEIHGILRRMLYERGQIDPREVDIRFDAPTKEWIGRLTRPTINLFLCDMKENTELRQGSFEVTRSNGRAERRRPPRRIDLQYVVSGLATDVDDAHLLLWRTLATLIRYPEVPSELVPPDLDLSRTALKGRLATPEERANVLDIWSGLGAEPRPTVTYVLTVPLDVDVVVEAPLILTRTLRASTALDPDAIPDTSTRIAGVVRGKDGEPLTDVRVAVEGSAREAILTDQEGRFMLHRIPSGEVRLRLARADGTEKTITLEVPSGSYDLVLE